MSTQAEQRKLVVLGVGCVAVCAMLWLWSMLLSTCAALDAPEVRLRSTSPDGATVVELLRTERHVDEEFERFCWIRLRDVGTFTSVVLARGPFEFRGSLEWVDANTVVVRSAEPDSRPLTAAAAFAGGSGQLAGKRFTVRFEPAPAGGVLPTSPTGLAPAR